METPETAGIYFAHRIALLAFSGALFVAVLEIMRRGLLKERYALLWLAVSGASILLAAFPGLVTRAAALFHFQYLTVLVMVTFVFTLALVLAFSVILSRLSERNRALAQEVALLAHALKNVEKRLDV